MVTGLSGSYAVQHELGRGGMATVFQALDLKHDRTVALKVLHDNLAASMGPERFKREIRFAARLQHPHILSVFDSGETSGQYWFTMPYVSGESLRDRLTRMGRLPVDEALTIVREAAQALTYAHGEGVLHRDIKPENILLTKDGSTLVADFGIARAIAEDTASTSLTQTGSAIGTPTYMAPEQATASADVDGRADEYSLAAVAYEMLTGQPPFSGATVAALMAARFSQAAPSARKLRPEIPSSIDAALQRALALKPADRFPTVLDFARAVAPSMTTPTHTDSYRTVRRPLGASKGVALIAGIAAVAVVGALVLRAKRSPAIGTSAPAITAAAPSGPARIAVLPFENLGDSADAYFANGVADAVRGKLLSLPGVEVIARASSVSYAGTKKNPQQIAGELGVRYLLTGTVRWEKVAGGKSIVHLNPELVEVSGEGAAASRWTEPFDQPLTNVFAVQADIAGKVAEKLRGALAGTDLTRIQEAPTTDAAAYDAYLRGAAIVSNDPASLRQKIALLQQAVGRDSSFAEAWALLEGSAALLYTNAVASTSVARMAYDAAQHVERLAPNRALSHTTWASYYTSFDQDLGRAQQELETARRLEPNDAQTLGRLGQNYSEQGRGAEGLDLLRDAARLDPLSSSRWLGLTSGLTLERRYNEALRAGTRAMALAPVSLGALLRVLAVQVAMDNRAAADSTIAAMHRVIPEEQVNAYLATYEDYGWLLDSAAQTRLLSLPAAAFDNDPGTWALVHAQLLRVAHRDAEAKTWAVRAADTFAEQTRRVPDDEQTWYLRGLALAYAGRVEAADAVLEQARGVPHPTRGAYQRTYYDEMRARAAVLNGQNDRALDMLEQILAKPGLLGPGRLKLDPVWAPLRGNPRFEKLVAMKFPG